MQYHYVATLCRYEASTLFVDMNSQLSIKDVEKKDLYI